MSRREQLVHASDSPLAAIVRKCSHVARSNATVLLTGETGTGKEVFARFVHDNSPRRDGPFVPVNCGAIPETLLESELFGYVKGAFTGAATARRGRVALAEGGTLFLDEIGELPLSLQVKLLRLLQERTYEPVGSSESVSADFRLVVATNRDLEAEVAKGHFRKDLYYRLLVCPVELVPLRRRRMDIVPLFVHFWQERGEVRALSPDVLRAIVDYDWPGNVRELQNVVERVSVCAENAVIEASDLPHPIGVSESCLARGTTELDGVDEEEAAVLLLPPLPPVPSAPHPSASTPRAHSEPPEPALAETSVAGGEHDTAASAASAEAALVSAAMTAAHSLEHAPVDLPSLLQRLETILIDAALEKSEGNKKAAADLLGLQRTTLVEKLRRRAKSRVSAPGSTTSAATSTAA